MTKADWLDFFEAINGRSATAEEIAAALAAGEFQDDARPTVGVDETAVQETVDSVTPIQETTVQAQPATPVQEVSGQGTAQASLQEQVAQPNPFAQGLQVLSSATATPEDNGVRWKNRGECAPNEDDCLITIVCNSFHLSCFLQSLQC